MSTTLTNGLKLPDKGSVDWYSDMQNNYAILDGAVGTVAEHTTALAGKAPAVHTHTKADITDFPAYGNTAGTICEGNDSRLSDARTPVAHTHTKSDVTDLFNSANTWSDENKYTSGFILSNISWSGVTPPSSTKPTVIEFKNSDTRQGRYINRISSTSSETWIETIRNVDANTSYNHTVVFQVDNSGNKSVYPYSNNDIDLGIATKQWKSVYAQSYYYNGTAWGLDKENTWSANQKITNNPSYLYFKNTSMTMGTAPASNKYSGVIFQDSNNTELGNVTYKKHKNSNNVLILNVKNTDGSNNYEGSVNLALTPSGSGSFYPEGVDCNLGQASTPWKSFNGINPGALSLPNLTAQTYDPSNGWYDLDTLDWDLTGSPTDISSNILKDGYLYVCLACDSTGYVIICEGVFGYPNCYYSTSGLPVSGYARALLPVRKGTEVRLYLKGTSIYAARLFPALGNV